MVATSEALALAKTLRQQFQQSDDARDAGLSTHIPEVDRIDNLPYGPLPKWQTLDLYRPHQAITPLFPVIINIHGGGWVYGTKETYQFYGMNLAKEGFAVINGNYRLPPQV